MCRHGWWRDDKGGRDCTYLANSANMDADNLQLGPVRVFGHWRAEIGGCHCDHGCSGHPSNVTIVRRIWNRIKKIMTMTAALSSSDIPVYWSSSSCNCTAGRVSVTLLTILSSVDFLIRYLPIIDCPSHASEGLLLWLPLSVCVLMSLRGSHTQGRLLQNYPPKINN